MGVFSKAKKSEAQTATRSLVDTLLDRAYKRGEDRVVAQDAAENLRASARQADERSAAAEKDADALSRAADILIEAGVSI